MTKKPFYMIMGFNTLLDWCYIMADIIMNRSFCKTDLPSSFCRNYKSYNEEILKEGHYYD